MKNSPSATTATVWNAGDCETLREYSGWMDVPSTQTPVSKDVGQGFYESLSVKEGAALVRGKHKFLEERTGQIIRIAELTLTFNEPSLVVQTAGAGRAVVCDRIGNQEFSLSKNRTIFQYADRVTFARDHDASEANQLYHLAISRSVLHDMIGEAGADRLLAELKISDSPVARAYDMPSGFSNELHASMTNALSGGFKKLYAQGKFLKYLSLISNHVTCDVDEVRSSRKTRVIRQLHEELIEMRGDVPNLSDLSRRYGLSVRTLNDAFKSEFGDSIYAYIKNQRLNDARAKLLDTDMPIKVIAADLGYAHVTNFMLAFKKKFGYPPGSLRR